MKRRRTTPTPAAAPDARKITRPGPVSVCAGVGTVAAWYGGSRYGEAGIGLGTYVTREE